VFESLHGYKVTMLRLNLEFANAPSFSEVQWELFPKSSGWSLSAAVPKAGCLRSIMEVREIHFTQCQTQVKRV